MKKKIECLTHFLWSHLLTVTELSEVSTMVDFEALEKNQEYPAERALHRAEPV